MQQEDITHQIIGCAYTVYNTLGFGFLGKVYENSMMIELRKAGLKAEQQHPIKVKYNDAVVGDYLADLLVENGIIVELKSIVQLGREHEVQLVNYLKATGKDIGLLIIFGEKIQIKRKTRELQKKASC